MMNNKGVVCVVYEKIGNEYVFNDFVNEDAAKIKQRFGDKYKVVILELPRRLGKESILELVIKDPRYETPKLDNLKLDVLEGIVY